MVKRAKSPEIIEEARYFTVCQPFPLNANWIFEQDQQDCATWIAECIGLEHLFAIHHKPSARGMILLEVSKMFTDHERLLGEHRWSEILKEPNAEEEMRVSQVFHSFYPNGREAQKDGWKNLVVKSNWFKKGWAPGKGRFKQPYPQTHWCPIPIEDKTNKQLCRPLPAYKIAPPRSSVGKPVVGSATWAETKDAGKPTAEALTKSWNGVTEVVNRVNEPIHSKPNAGSSIPVNGHTNPSAASLYPPLAGISATSAPNKSQASSKPAPSSKNKRKKPVPLNQFVNGGGNKTWNKPYTIPNGPLPPAVKSPPSPKPTPRSANAWDKPIQLPVSPAPAVGVKKEAPPEDYSSWGKEAATPTVEPEKLWNAPPPKKKKANQGKDNVAIPQTSISSGTSPGDTKPSSPHIRNITPHDVLPQRDFRPSAESEGEGSDDDDGLYGTLSKMKFIDIDDLPPEESEYAHINPWEKGGTVDVEPETKEDPAMATEDRTYGNLWLSEEDPRAIPLPDPELICPTHHIACKKGICEDMAKILRAKKMRELKAKWEEEGKNKKNKGRRNKDGDDTSNESPVDGDKFTIARPRGKNRFGRHKKAQDTPEKEEPSHIGRMRAFPADTPSGHADSEEGGSTPNDAPEIEGQIW